MSAEWQDLEGRGAQLMGY